MNRTTHQGKQSSISRKPTCDKDVHRKLPLYGILKKTTEEERKKGGRRNLEPITEITSLIASPYSMHIRNFTLIVPNIFPV
jgi:hypothetical protein